MFSHSKLACDVAPVVHTMVFSHNTRMKGTRELTTSDAPSSRTEVPSPPTEARTDPTVFFFLSTDLFRFFGFVVFLRLELVVPAVQEREEEVPTEDS